MICQHVDSTWHIEACWPQKTMGWMSVSNTFYAGWNSSFRTRICFLLTKWIRGNETKRSSGASTRRTQWLCTFPLRKYILLSFSISEKYTLALANLKSLKIVSYELFFHDSLSSISVRLGSCNKTLDYLLLGQPTLWPLSCPSRKKGTGARKRNIYDMLSCTCIHVEYCINYMTPLVYCQALVPNTGSPNFSFNK